MRKTCNKNIKNLQVTISYFYKKRYNFLLKNNKNLI